MRQLFAVLRCAVGVEDYILMVPPVGRSSRREETNYYYSARRMKPRWRNGTFECGFSSENMHIQKKIGIRRIAS